MRRAVTLSILAPLCLLALGSPAAAKLPKGVAVAVECGFGGLVHLGRVNPVRITLDNQAEHLNLSGDLVLEYEGVEYATKLELPSPSSKQIFLYFPCRNYSPVLTLRVRTKAYTEDFTLTEPRSFMTMRAEDSSVLVITDKAGSLGVLNNVSAARLFRNPYQFVQPEFGAGYLRPTYARLDQTDATPKYFAQADVVVLAGVDYGQVTPELAEALKAAASGGTSIVFSLGLHGAGVSASPLAELCPLAGSATTQVGDLGTFGQRYGFKAPPAATFATGRVQDGAKVLASSAGVPVVVQKGWGAGTATALAFDVTAEPFKQKPGLERLIRDSVLPIDANLNSRLWFSHPGSQTRPLALLAQAKPMPPGFVLLFLVGYVVLIGPLNFFLLTRFNRRTLVWTTIPLIIAAFGYGGLNTGYLYRGSDNVLASVQEVHVYPEAAYSPYQAGTLVFTAAGSNYKLGIDDKSAVVYPDSIPIPDPYGMNAGAPAGLGGLRGRIDTTGAPQITASQGKWTSRTFVYQGYADLGAKVASRLVAGRSDGDEYTVQGSFDLDLPVDLHNTVLYAGRKNQRLGFLERQGTYTAASSFEDKALPQSNYLTGHREDLVQSLANASQLMSDYTNEALLVGFSTELPVLAKLPLNHVDYSLSMIVVHLPCREEVSNSGPATVLRGRLIGGSGFMVQQDPYRYGRDFESTAVMRRYILQQDSYITAQYQVGGHVDSKDKLHIHLQVLSPSTEQPIPNPAAQLTIDVWNNGAWVRVRIPEGDPSVYIPMLGNVDSEHMVTLRFKARSEILFDWPSAEAY